MSARPPLPLCRPHELPEGPASRRWLIEGLWAEQAVGLIGGEPKCCKSFLALELAVAVASGAPALRRFPARQTGPVLLFAGEDAPQVVRERLEGIAQVAGVAFDALDLHVIATPTLRLDLPDDARRLGETVAALRPKLLVLDPFVRLHRIDENAAAEVAPLLARLRALQRRYETAVLLVHHARKGAQHARGGQALRGSSELHAWGDSNLYLRRRGERLWLSTEHRAAPSTEGLALALRSQRQTLALEVVDGVAEVEPPPAPSAHERIAQTLAAAATPLTREQLRQAARLRTQTLGDALAELTAQGRVVKAPEGYRLADR
jgi:hypothetical protein